MSARNYLSAREKNKFDCLPNINQQKFVFRNSGQEFPSLSATSGLVNRNLSYSYDIQPYIVDSGDRAGTPFSDFFSESETGTPDFHSEESDSSSGSALRESTAEATKTLADEWERIERTLYDEEGEKSMRVQILEECRQWRALHPQLRVVGKAIPLPERRPGYRPIEYDEVIAIHYSDYEQFSESEERLSQSSTDVTPQNSPRVSICENLCDQKTHREKTVCEDFEPKLSREKVSFFPTYEESDLPDTFSSLLHITPIHIRSPSHRKRQNPSILKSDIASSRWMRNSRPDSSINCDRNSAKSFVSLDTRNYGNVALSASERNKMLNSRVLTARQRDIARLDPLCTPEIGQSDLCRIPNNINGSYQYSIRKVSLPPLLLEEEKKKVSINSAKKPIRSRKSSKGQQLDRLRYNN